MSSSVMKSETMKMTLVRFSVFIRCCSAGRSAVLPCAGSSDQHCCSSDQATARVLRGGLYNNTRSENARKPVLIWSDSAENSSDPLMNVIVSFFEYPDVPRSI